MSNSDSQISLQLSERFLIAHTLIIPKTAASCCKLREIVILLHVKYSLYLLNLLSNTFQYMLWVAYPAGHGPEGAEGDRHEDDRCGRHRQQGQARCVSAADPLAITTVKRRLQASLGEQSQQQHTSRNAACAAGLLALACRESVISSPWSDQLLEAGRCLAAAACMTGQVLCLADGRAIPRL